MMNGLIIRTGDFSGHLLLGLRYLVSVSDHTYSDISCPEFSRTLFPSLPVWVILENCDSSTVPSIGT